MTIKTGVVSIIIIAISCILAGCASDERQVNYKAIGEEACRDHGGLLLVDQAGETTVYTCKSGMTYKLKEPDLLVY
jgi:hypothetical protein